MASAVMLVTGANVWTMKNATRHPTGFWSEEFVTRHRKFTKAGLTVTVASPGGVAPPVDPLSFNLSYNHDDAVAMPDHPKTIVAGVCHGPAGLLTASRPDGTWACKDRQLAAFSNEEETQAGFAGNAPCLLDDRLRIAGARYVAKAAWTPHVVVDGNLITGQQNYSAGVTADAVLKQLTVGAR